MAASDSLFTSLENSLTLQNHTETTSESQVENILLEQEIEQDEDLLTSEEIALHTKNVGLSEMTETVYSVSEHALAPSTMEGYRSQFRGYLEFLQRFSKPLRTAAQNPTKNTPIFICLYINFCCGKPDPEDSRWYVRERQGYTWSHAMKVRASLAYYYAYHCRWENVPYFQTGDGSYSGNPVNTDIVSRYMKGLRREKTRAGEQPESVRAITSGILQQLYAYNASVPWRPQLERIPNGAGGRVWGGARQRLMMTLIYAISFLCFLRIEETLRLECRHFRLHDAHTGRVDLTLDFRKTKQDGEIQPFIFYFNREEPWLDVPTLLLEWLHQSEISSGFLFRPFNAFDQISLFRNTKLSQTAFLQNFRHNLADIEENNFNVYGGHSFRRGGVQYMMKEKRWSLIKCCSWGGWSFNLDNLTIIRYIFGSNDDPTYLREDFLNPAAQKGSFCGHCGRTCDCA